MRNLQISRLATSAAAILLAPLLLGAQGTASNFDMRILASHNRERDALGLAPLHWNNALAKSAQNWSDYLARTGRFEHEPRNAAEPQGENIWIGTPDAFPAEAMVDNWLSEKRHFKQGRFPSVSKTGAVRDVGHYTQIIWRKSSSIGCALSRGAGEDILVCRYSSPGNMMGERPF